MMIMAILDLFKFQGLLVYMACNNVKTICR